jgi:hypothetical protein
MDQSRFEVHVYHLGELSAIAVVLFALCHEIAKPLLHLARGVGMRLATRLTKY